MESMVAQGGMPIPDVIAVFVDPEKPKEFFCIVMNDMGIEHEPMDQITGVTLQEQTELLSVAAKLHTTFWKHSILKHPTVCNGNTEACALFFRGWFDGAVSDPTTCDRYRQECLTKLQFDPFPNPDQRIVNRLLMTHPVKFLEHFHKTLDSRPFTLCHGDMRSDNLFQRKDKSGYRVIDWQTYSASPPGVEMHQLLGASMKNLDDYAQLPTLLRAYLNELHSMCPASREYTFEMLWEDFRICAAVLQVCFAMFIGDMIKTMGADAPNMSLFREALPRYFKCYEQLDFVSYVLDAAKALGLVIPQKHEV